MPGFLDDLKNSLMGTDTPNFSLSPSGWDMSGWGNQGQGGASPFGGQDATAGGSSPSWLPKIDTQTPTDWSQAQPGTTHKQGLLSKLGNYLTSPEFGLALGTALRSGSDPNAFAEESAIVGRRQQQAQLALQQQNQAAKDAALGEAWTTDADGNQTVDQNAYMKALQKHGYTGDFGAAINESRALGDQPDIQKTDEGIYSINKRTGKAKLLQATPKPITVGADQTVLLPPGWGGPPGAGGAGGGVVPGAPQGPPAGSAGPPMSPGGFSAAVQGREGAGQNPYSSASGVGQFLGKIDPTTGKGSGTWFDVMRSDPQFAPLIQGKTDAQILALRQNPQVAEAAINSYAAQNRAALQRAGIANPSDAQLGMAHGFGAGGALKILASAPNTPIENIIGAHTAAINGLTGQNAGQVVAGFNRRFGQGGGAGQATLQGGSGGDQIASGQDPALAGMPPGWTAIHGAGKKTAGAGDVHWLTPQEKMAQKIDPNLPVYQDAHGNYKTLPGYKPAAPPDPQRIAIQQSQIDTGRNLVRQAMKTASSYYRLGAPSLGIDIDTTSGPVAQYVTSHIGGTDAYRLKGQLKGITSQIALQAVQQMRALSQHGGGMSNVAYKEFQAIANTVANLDQFQGKEALQGALQEVLKHYDNAETILHQMAKTPEAAQYSPPTAGGEGEEEDTNPFQMQ